MDFLSRIIVILLSFFQIFSFLFPSLNDPLPEEPDEPSSGVEEEDPTDEPQGCQHLGGNATCIAKAICIRCGEEYGDFADHSYTTKVYAPTCTEDGYTVYSCQNCSDTYVDNNKAALGHDYKSRVIEPTCTEKGRTVYTCASCGDYYSENEIPEIGHNYIPEEKAPTCTDPGVTVYTCDNCGDSYTTDDLPALGHSYSHTVTPPTCTEEGYTTHVCSSCSDTYVSDRVPPTDHSFTNYTPDGNATCTKDGTKTAYCDNGCGGSKTVADENSVLPHTDNNKDKHCDIGGEELFMEFTHLTYPSNAVMKAEEWSSSITLDKVLSRADKNDDLYASNQGYTDTNGIFISPYYTVKIDGISVPAYGTVTYSGETEKGTLHSFSEIYVEKNEYCTFEIEIASAGLNITKARVIPASLGEDVFVSEGKVTAILSGYGAHTFIFNDDENNYAYTIFVREEIDEDAEIAALREQGYTVHVVDGYMTHSYTNFHGTPNQVIYLKKGSYVVADHKFDINSDSDNQSKEETGDDGSLASQHNGLGLNRFPFINVHDTNNIKILGYGAIDLTHLDRGERRGLVFSFTNNIEVRGVKLINSPEWTFITYRCNNVTIKDVDIFGYRQNSDAFAICNSQNVLLDGCFAKTGDDAFCVKTMGGDANAITQGITVQNCYAWATKARAFGIFGETYKNMSDITFKDCYVLKHDALWDETKIPAIGIVAEVTDATSAYSINNVTFENIEISNNKAAAANVIIFNQVGNLNISDITFKNISYSSNAVMNHVVTYNSTSTISNVIFENTTCNGANVVDSNKTLYFKEDSYHGNYITVK